METKGAYAHHKWPIGILMFEEASSGSKKPLSGGGKWQGGNLLARKADKGVGGPKLLGRSGGFLPM